MAANMIVFDPSSESEEERPKKVTNGTDSDSSDSDGPAPLRPPPRITPSLADLITSEDVEDSPTPNEGIYSSRVTNIFNRQVMGQFELNDISDSDEEPEIKIVEEPKAKATGRKTKRQAKASTPSPPLYAVIDSDEEATEPKGNDCRDRSPTPPPSHRLTEPPKRRRRTPKGTKVAIQSLQSLRGRLSKNQKAGNDSEDILILDSPSPKSPEKGLVVKIRTIHGLHRVMMKPTESFERVFREMSEKLATDVDQIVMYHGDQSIKPYDTPKLLKLTITDILDCHTRRKGEVVDEEQSSEDDLDDFEDPTMVRLRIQGKNTRTTTLTIRIKRTDPLEKMMREYAMRCGMVFDRLTFHFDGDMVRRTDTADQLDMDDDDCIDVNES